MRSPLQKKAHFLLSHKVTLFNFKSCFHCSTSKGHFKVLWALYIKVCTSETLLLHPGILRSPACLWFGNERWKSTFSLPPLSRCLWELRAALGKITDALTPSSLPSSHFFDNTTLLCKWSTSLQLPLPAQFYNNWKSELQHFCYSFNLKQHPDHTLKNSHNVFHKEWLL